VTVGASDSCILNQSVYSISIGLWIVIFTVIRIINYFVWSEVISGCCMNLWDCISNWIH